MKTVVKLKLALLLLLLGSLIPLQQVASLKYLETVSTLGPEQKEQLISLSEGGTLSNASFAVNWPLDR